MHELGREWRRPSDRMTDMAERLGVRPGMGCYRRAIRLHAGPGYAVAEMEDDPHHLAVRLRAVDGRLASAEGIAIRTPYTICPDATGQLASLHGMPLEQLQRMPAPERSLQCMHLLDLAVLAARHMGDTPFARLYRIEVDHGQDPPPARLWRDGVEVLGWRIDGRRMRGSRFDGVAFNDLAAHLHGLDADEAEAALVLRRASLISFVRRVDLDAIPDSRAINPDGPSNCYAKQGGRRDRAKRSRGSTLDFWGEGCWPLAGEPVFAPLWR